MFLLRLDYDLSTVATRSGAGMMNILSVKVVVLDKDANLRDLLPQGPFSGTQGVQVPRVKPVELRSLWRDRAQLQLTVGLHWIPRWSLKS